MSNKNNYVLSLDQGGHSTRAIVFDLDGRVLLTEKVGLLVNRPQPGFVEQDAGVMLDSFAQLFDQLKSSMGESTADIAHAALATQRSNSVCWNKHSGNALSPLISWQDTRTLQQLSRYPCQSDWIHEKTGLYLTAHYGATKYDWCLREIRAVADAYAKQELYWGPLASFLVYHLTQQHGYFVDPANASRTLLMNIADLRWDQDLLHCFGIEQALLPEIKASVADYGNLATLDLPLRVVCGDQSATLYAYGEPQADTVYINIGTGAFLQYFTGAEVKHVPGLLSGVAARFANATQYTLEATVNGAGSALTFVEDELGMSYRDAQANFSTWLARDEDVPVFLNGVSGLGSPFWQSDFPSRFIDSGDLRQGIDDWKKIVAVAESILFLIATNLQRIIDQRLPVRQLWVSGGLAATDALCQRLADVCGLPVLRPEECEATARGIACLSVGLPQSWRNMRLDRFNPRENTSLLQRYQRWRMAMSLALEAA